MGRHTGIRQLPPQCCSSEVRTQHSCRHRFDDVLCRGATDTEQEQAEFRLCHGSRVRCLVSISLRLMGPVEARTVSHSWDAFPGRANPSSRLRRAHCFRRVLYLLDLTRVGQENMDETIQLTIADSHTFGAIKRW